MQFLIVKSVNPVVSINDDDVSSCVIPLNLQSSNVIFTSPFLLLLLSTSSSSLPSSSFPPLTKQPLFVSLILLIVDPLIVTSPPSFTTTNGASNTTSTPLLVERNEMSLNSYSLFKSIITPASNEARMMNEQVDMLTPTDEGGDINDGIVLSSLLTRDVNSQLDNSIFVAVFPSCGVGV